MSDATALNRQDFMRHSVGGGFALGTLMGLGLDLRAAQRETSRFKFAYTREVPSVCTYCAVGCGQLISVLDGKIVNIEGNPDSLVNRGTLCPKGSATYQLVVNPNRFLHRQLHRGTLERDKPADVERYRLAVAAVPGLSGLDQLGNVGADRMVAG